MLNPQPVTNPYVSLVNHLLSLKSQFLYLENKDNNGAWVTYF